MVLVILGAVVSAIRNPGRNASTSIVGGQPAEECEWTHQVGLNSGPGQPLTCGGMLISADWVLSAAHCFRWQSRVNVVAGEWNTNQLGGTEQNRYTSEIIEHPNFSPRTMDNDFALLKLESPMTLNKCVGSVRLPDHDVAAGTSCWITGWGTLRQGSSQPHILQEVQVTVVDNGQCNSDYQESITGLDILDSMLCAQGRNASGGITDACQGDSGGPLVCEEGGSWVLHGATSFGDGCAQAEFPGVWARVYNQLDWIIDVTGISPISPTTTTTTTTKTTTTTLAPDPDVCEGSLCSRGVHVKIAVSASR